MNPRRATVSAPRGAPSGPRLWIIDPSIRVPETQGAREIAGDWPGRLRLFRPAQRPEDGPRPETGHATDGIVLMGSKASVHDPLDWIAALSSWLAPVLAGQLEIPLLGICFGHQLIGHLAGAEVGPVHEQGRKIVAVEESALEGGRLLPGARKLRAVVSHRDEVKHPPPGYRVVARRPGIAVDGMEHRARPIFSFQFHPEAREEFARHAGIDPLRIDARLRRETGELLAAFRGWVQRHAARREARGPD